VTARQSFEITVKKAKSLISCLADRHYPCGACKLTGSA